MELISTLQTLWQHRRLVLAAALAATAAGVTVAYRVSLLPPQLHDRQYTVGIARSTVLIDTPRSTLADLTPSGADVLLSRTQLLANLMASGPVQLLIAERARIPAQLLTVSAPGNRGAPVPTPLAQGAAATPVTGVEQLTVSTDPTVPIIALSAEAPTVAQATLLAAGAVDALQTYLGSVAMDQRIPLQSRVVITSLGPPRAAAVVRGPRRLYGAVATAVLFALLCTLIVVSSGLAGSWDRSADRNRRIREAVSWLDGVAGIADDDLLARNGHFRAPAPAGVATPRAPADAE